jgi:hypothetical protein
MTDDLIGDVKVTALAYRVSGTIREPPARPAMIVTEREPSGKVQRGYKRTWVNLRP